MQRIMVSLMEKDGLNFFDPFFYRLQMALGFK